MAEHEAGSERLRLLALPVKPGFGVRVIVLEPGCERPYQAAEWRDALVQVDRGHVDLEFCGGAYGRFGPGDLLWLCGMGVRALRNREREPAVLVALFRSPPDPAPWPPGASRTATTHAARDRHRDISPGGAVACCRGPWPARLPRAHHRG